MTRPGPFQCPICYDSIKKPTMLKACQHVFCKECIDRWINAQEKDHTCPFCREKIRVRKSPFIRIRPKYESVEMPMMQDSMPSSSSQALGLAELKEQLAAKTQELNKLVAEENTYEQQQKIKLEALNQKLESVRNEVRPLEAQLTQETKNLEKLLQKMPFTSTFFDKICEEVNKDPRKLNATEPYDQIHSAWLIARGHFESRNKMLENLERTKRQIGAIQRRNIQIRLLCKQVGPEEFSRRVSNDTFRKLCKLMGWNYDDYIIMPPILQYNHPKDQQMPTASSSSTNKRSFVGSSTPASRPAKIPKPTGSFFRNTLFENLDDENDMF